MDVLHYVSGLLQIRGTKNALELEQLVIRFDSELNWKFSQSEIECIPREIDVIDQKYVIR